MTQWTDRFRAHALWQQLETLGPSIDQAARREDVEAGTLDALERLRAVLTFLGKRLAGSDPLLLQSGPLDNINSAVQNAATEIQNFIANGNTGHITNANSHGDTALVHLAQLNVPFVSEDLAGLKEAAITYRDSRERALKQVQGTSKQANSDLEGLRSRFSEFTSEISSERQRLSALASDFQSQFSTAQDSRSRDHSDAQTARQERFANILADYTTKLTEQAAEFIRQRPPNPPLLLPGRRGLRRPCPGKIQACSRRPSRLAAPQQKGSPLGGLSHID